MTQNNSKNLAFHIVNVFTTNTVFSGNPAAVVLLDTALDFLTMQKIASEFNLSETAFVFKKKDIYNIRWFTPEIEVDFCVHATLASAFVLLDSANTISLQSQQYLFKIKKHSHSLYELEMPRDMIWKCERNRQIEAMLNIHQCKSFYKTQNTKSIMIETSETELVFAEPNFDQLRLLDIEPFSGIILTAKSEQTSYDFVSRCFYPWEGINEDPVTGSAHSALAVYWQMKLKKNDFVAFQASQRGGKITCSLQNEHVFVAGKCELFASGEIKI